MAATVLSTQFYRDRKNIFRVAVQFQADDGDSPVYNLWYPTEEDVEKYVDLDLERTRLAVDLQKKVHSRISQAVSPHLWVDRVVGEFKLKARERRAWVKSVCRLPNGGVLLPEVRLVVLDELEDVSNNPEPVDTDLRLFSVCHQGCRIDDDDDAAGVASVWEKHVLKSDEFVKTKATLRKKLYKRFKNK
jgi:hypothetical protein